MLPIFFTPVLKQTIWGGNRLAGEYGLAAPGTGIAEAWMVSAHPAGDCVVREGRWKGMHCSRLWQQYPVLFGNADKTGHGQFPLLIKLIDAAAPLSVQVHPDDAYAARHEQLPDGCPCRGKSECWTILQAEQGAALVLGHTAQTRQQAAQMIQQGRWQQLLRRVPVQPGDFFRIDPGTVHAIGGGIQLLEVQQSSDITYRLYDYDRLQNGKPRPLHLRQALEVMTVPFAGNQPAPVPLPVNLQAGRASAELLEQCDYFSVQRLALDGGVLLPPMKKFCAAVVLQGTGEVDGVPVHKGDAFILPHGADSWRCSGKMQMIFSFPAE